jgi:NAD(P)-dependent dehydrogenase (short-subunit alcohol dehydrogenase family)
LEGKLPAGLPTVVPGLWYIFIKTARRQSKPWPTLMAASVLSGSGGDAIRAQSPLNRVARPEEVAAVVLFLAAEGTDYLTGSIIDVNGASYLRS